MKRPRHLSAEERALWDSVAKQAKPLRKKPKSPAATVRASPLPTGERSDRQVDAKHRRRSDLGEGAFHQTTKSPLTPTLKERAKLVSAPAGRGGPPSPSPPPPIAPIQRREKSRLARGVREIDARIDLHGMTQARAHRALLAFLQRAQADGCRYVLVITGKGKPTAEGHERGVLRRQVPEWFSHPDFRVLVTGYEEAGIGHGGAGALYVRVRRG